MKTIAKTAPLALLGVALIAAVTTLLALGPFISGKSAHGQLGITVGIDMDPLDMQLPADSANSCTGPGAGPWPAGQGTCTLGTIDRCVSVANVAGTDFKIDLFVQSLDNGWLNFNDNLNFPQGTVIEQADDVTTATVVLQAQSVGSAVINFGAATPDTVSPHSVAVSENGTAEVGAIAGATVARITMRVAPAAANGLYNLYLDGPPLGAYIDKDGSVYTLAQILDGGTGGLHVGGYGQVALGVACPGAVTNADVAIASQQVRASDCTSAPPTQIGAATPTTLCLHKSLVNNGPTTPVDVSITASATGAADCTITAAPANPTSQTGLTSTPVPVDEKFTVNCSQPSLHTFAFNNGIVVTTANVTDPNTANNSASTPLSMNVIASADAAIASQALVTPPTQININTNTQLTLRKTLHNNGTFGPVSVSIIPNATPPAGCTATASGTNPTSASLPVSVDVVVDEVWTISCSQPSTHAFSFGDTIAVTTAHVVDPTPANNTASTPFSVDVIASADAAISSQALVSPPSQINQGQNVNVTLRKTLHNNGTFGPVSVSITPSATPPAGCTANPSGTNPTSANLPVSADVVVDEAWTINCSQVGAKSFSFDNAIAVTTPHVVDPTPANNSASTPLPVTVVPPEAQADVKITSQSLLSPPAQIDASQSVDVTLRKTLHNNGPAGPVDVSITASAVAPAGCTATPGASNLTSATLPVSVAQTVDEVWTLHCTAPSTHAFTFNNAIAITTPNTNDPNTLNNSASTPLSVDVIATADAKITAQSLVNPPTQITQGQNVPVTLRKTLHNNGPFGPANVSITASAVAPTGCTATPSPSNPASASLAVSAAQTVDEAWTINCSQTGSKSFSFDNAIAVTTPHVNDPDTSNNSASTPLGVTVVPAATPTPTPTPPPGVIDYGVVHLVPPGSSFSLGRSGLHLSIYNAVVKNFGTVRDGPASLTLNVNPVNPSCHAPVVFPASSSVTLNPGSQTARLFAVLFFSCDDPSPSPDYIVTAKVSAPGDSNPANDTATATVDVRKPQGSWWW